MAVQRSVPLQHHHHQPDSQKTVVFMDNHKRDRRIPWFQKLRNNTGCCSDKGAVLTKGVVGRGGLGGNDILLSDARSDMQPTTTAEWVWGQGQRHRRTEPLRPYLSERIHASSSGS